MRPLLILTLGLALPLTAAYTYFLTDSFPSINTAIWQTNGTIAGGAGTGLSSAAANGGSVIYKGTISDGTTPADSSYEVRAQLKIGASGGTFTL